MTDKNTTETPENPDGVSLATASCSAYRVRITRLAVLPPGEPLFSEKCTNVSIDDNAAGEYVAIEQQSGSVEAKDQRIEMNDESEWASIKAAVDQMFKEINSQNVEERNPEIKRHE